MKNGVLLLQFEVYDRPSSHPSAEYQLTKAKLFELMVAPFVLMQFLGIVVCNYLTPYPPPPSPSLAENTATAFFRG